MSRAAISWSGFYICVQQRRVTDADISFSFVRQYSWGGL
jgi:hypothetical protein